MSPEQLEIQRMRFEKAIPMPLPECFVFVNDRYIQNQNLSIGELPDTLKAYNCFFEAWIKCVESNEIELPKQYFFEHPNRSKEFYYKPKDIHDAIEAQGFKVKA